MNVAFNGARHVVHLYIFHIVNECTDDRPSIQLDTYFIFLLFKLAFVLHCFVLPKSEPIDSHSFLSNTLLTDESVEFLAVDFFSKRRGNLQKDAQFMVGQYRICTD